MLSSTLEWGWVLERVVITAAGAICMYLGYRLFDKARERHVRLDAEGKSIESRVGDLGPGVFFVVVGTAVLALSMWRALAGASEEQGNESEPQRDGLGVQAEQRLLLELVDVLASPAPEDEFAKAAREALGAKPIQEERRARALRLIRDRLDEIRSAEPKGAR